MSEMNETNAAIAQMERAVSALVLELPNQVWEDVSAIWKAARIAALGEIVAYRLVAEKLGELIREADRWWFHEAHGLHDDAHHQAHRPLDVCVPLLGLTPGLRAAREARGMRPGE